MKITEIIENINNTEYSIEMLAKYKILSVLSDIANEPGMDLISLQSAIREAHEYSYRLCIDKVKVK